MSIPTLYEKILETRKYENCLKLTDQREKVLTGKNISFSVEKPVLQIRSTLIAVKVTTKLVSFYLLKALY